MTIESPYAESTDVARFLRTTLKGGNDFTASTIPTKEDVDFILILVSASIDSVLAEIGYKLPLTELENEVFPEYEVNFLKMLTVIGSADKVLRAMKPAPASAAGKTGKAENAFSGIYKKELERLRNSVPLRAQYYIGTSAEFRLAEPGGPVSSYINNVLNKSSKYLTDNGIDSQKLLSDLYDMWEDDLESDPVEHYLDWKLLTSIT